ncbi:MAG: hypothetical protein ABL901_14880 [Hyphomicrobiaceae bacterium]
MTTDTNAAIVAALATVAATATPRPAANGKVLFILSEAVTFNGEVIKDFAYRRATGRDMRKALNTPKNGDRYLGLMVDLAELPEAFFLSLAGPDFMAFTDVLDGFFSRPQAT